MANIDKDFLGEDNKKVNFGDMLNNINKMYGGLYKNVIFAIPPGNNFKIFEDNIGYDKY